MEEKLQHQTTTQRSGLSPTGPGNRRPDGPKADHALTIKLDHSSGADQVEIWGLALIGAVRAQLLVDGVGLDCIRAL